MDPRRPSRVIDPKVRRVGFFAPDPPISDPDNHPLPANSPMIPHAFESVSQSQAMPVPNSTSSARPRRCSSTDESEQLVVGSYNPSQSVLGSSPASSGIGIDGEFSEESGLWIRRTDDGFGLTSAARLMDDQSTSSIEGVSAQVAETPNEVERNAKPLKGKTTKAERRALQEAQRAAKAAGKVH